MPDALLPQRLDVLDDALPRAAEVARRNPTATPEQVRARLARFGFRGSLGDRLVGDLSGRPTISTRAPYDALVAALAGYMGALAVASHDRALLDDLVLERIVDPAGGRLTS